MNNVIRYEKGAINCKDMPNRYPTNPFNFGFSVKETDDKFFLVENLGFDTYLNKCDRPGCTCGRNCGAVRKIPITVDWTAPYDDCMVLMFFQPMLKYYSDSLCRFEHFVCIWENGETKDLCVYCDERTNCETLSNNNSGTGTFKYTSGSDVITVYEWQGSRSKRTFAKFQRIYTGSHRYGPSQVVEMVARTGADYSGLLNWYWSGTAVNGVMSPDQVAAWNSNKSRYNAGTSPDSAYVYNTNVHSVHIQNYWYKKYYRKKNACAPAYPAPTYTTSTVWPASYLSPASTASRSNDLAQVNATIQPGFVRFTSGIRVSWGEVI
jgi:hypothetical protein